MYGTFYNIAFQEQRQQTLNLLTSRNLLTILKGFSPLYTKKLAED